MGKQHGRAMSFLRARAGIGLGDEVLEDGAYHDGRSKVTARRMFGELPLLPKSSIASY